MASLSSLPPEVLGQVIQHLPTASDLNHLSRTSKSVNSVIEKDGWRIFVAEKFPSIPTHAHWKAGAHALTTLSRNLDRRAFISNQVEPEGRIRNVADGTVRERWQRPKGQTMGYQAVLDSYEELTANDWASRKRVVAWGAGAELVVSVKTPGATQKTTAQSNHVRHGQRKQPQHQQVSSDETWLSYREKHHAEGRDDITSVNVLRPHQQAGESHDSSAETVVVGRANGELTLVPMSLHTKQQKVRQFDTANSPVRSTDISRSHKPLLATCLNDDRLAIYSLDSSLERVRPSSVASSTAGNMRSCRTWSTRFLSEDTLAITMGPSETILKVFRVGNEGLTKEPIRSFGNGKGTSTSAYPIRPLPSSAAAPSASNGTLLLTGNYDGVVRLHDMRSPEHCVARIKDPVDNSAIFSLETIGHERALAGSSSHSLLKVFDLRMTGDRAYNYLDFDSLKSNSRSSTHSDDYSIHSSGFNVFVGQNRQISSSGRRQPKESPIYSLTRPSEASPLLYAGLENSVVSFNFTSATDAHPDPQFDHVLKRDRGDYDPLSTWFSPPPFALTLYEQSGPSNMQMLYQRILGRHQSGLCVSSFQDCQPGYDERLSRISTSTRLSASRGSFSRRGPSS